MVFAGNSSYADFRNDAVQIGISIRDGVNQLIDCSLDHIFNASIPEHYREGKIFSNDDENNAYCAYQARKLLYTYNIKILAYNIATIAVVTQLAFIIFGFQLSLVASCLLLIGARKILKHSIEDSLQGRVSEAIKNVTKWFPSQEIDLGGMDRAGFFKTHTSMASLVKLQELVNRVRQTSYPS